jgi:hypothetical protein
VWRHGWALNTLFQRSGDKFIQIAIEYRFGVARFKVGA